MTRFPSPPVVAAAKALERTPAIEWIGGIEAYNLSTASRRDIHLYVNRRFEQEPSEAEDALMQSALLPWACDMAGLFQVFPLSSFQILLRKTSRGPGIAATPDSEELWTAQRALESDIVRLLAQDYGETGFYTASFVVKPRDRSPRLLVRPARNRHALTWRPGFGLVEDWLEAMKGWLSGVRVITFTLAGRPLSAHERVELQRLTG